MYMENNLFQQFGICDDKSNRVFIIAEMSANHNHSLDVAVETIRAAKAAGADAIKLQTYTADTLTINSDKPYFQIHQGTLWDGTTLYQLYQQAFTPWEWFPELMRVAAEENIVCFSSPFDKSSVDFLESLHVPAYKIASFEIVDIPLIEYIASKGKPMMISTGIATLDEIAEAINACHRQGNFDVALLKCTSSYPAPLDSVNLRTIPDMHSRFKLPIGLSDHTLSSSVAVAAVAVGARIVEKHFILDNKIGGPDAAFSMTKEKFAEMVSNIRQVEQALGKATYELTESVRKSRKFARSLFVVNDMHAGDLITEQNVRSIRPSDGLAPKFLPQILGRRVNCDIERGEPFCWEYLQ